MKSSKAPKKKKISFDQNISVEIDRRAENMAELRFPDPIYEKKQNISYSFGLVKQNRKYEMDIEIPLIPPLTVIPFLNIDFEAIIINNRLKFILNANHCGNFESVLKIRPNWNNKINTNDLSDINITITAKVMNKELGTPYYKHNVTLIDSQYDSDTQTEWQGFNNEDIDSD